MPYLLSAKSLSFAFLLYIDQTSPELSLSLTKTLKSKYSLKESESSGTEATAAEE